MEQLEALWSAYLTAERRDIRKNYLTALRAFLEEWAKAPRVDRKRWATSLLQEPLREHLPLRQLLLEAVVPVVLSEAHSGERLFAGLAADLLRDYQYYSVWTPHSEQGWRGVAEKLFASFPDLDELRRLLVEDDLRYFSYTLHELPMGVLVDHNGATAADCAQLRKWLSEAEARMTETERKTSADLLHAARKHYSLYAMYVADPGRWSSYEEYLRSIEETG